MNAADKYQQLALDCLDLAEATRDPAAQDRLLRLAEFCARLTDHTQDQANTGFWLERDKAA